MLPSRSTSGQARWDLTTREVDVLRLMAEGLTNGARGAGLHIARRTVETHSRASSPSWASNRPMTNPRVQSGRHLSRPRRLTLGLAQSMSIRSPRA